MVTWGRGLKSNGRYKKYRDHFGEERLERGKLEKLQIIWVLTLKLI
jgi:hypothetical protein